MYRSSKLRIVAVIVVVVAALAATALSPATGGASARGVVTASDGTITVAGLGYLQNFGDGATGAQARFKRANDDNEVKGYKFVFKEFADDKNDPATALSETRRLVTQDGIFALVPDLSLATPGDYLTQQQIPWFGPGYDATYCPDKGVKGFGFSPYGCILRQNPTRSYSNTFDLLKEALAAKGIQNPSVALIGTDSESAKSGILVSASGAQGAGFKVVYAKGAIPAPPAVVGDYSPYVQAMLTANGGKPPDVIFSQAPTAISLPVFNLVKSSGFSGALMSAFYSKLLLKALTGSYVFVQFAGFESDEPGIQKMNADIQAFKPGAQGSLALAGGYFGADFFIRAVQKALKSSKTLTSAAVQKAASTMTYQIKGTVGPTKYPASYQIPVKACATLLYDADGTAFTIAKPFSCTNKTYPIVKKFAQ